MLSHARHFISFDPDAPATFEAFAWSWTAAGKRTPPIRRPSRIGRPGPAGRPGLDHLYQRNDRNSEGRHVDARQFFQQFKALDAVTDFNAGDTILSFLPLSHVLERMTTFSFLFKGATIGYAESIDTVAENLLEVRPTIMVSVPRLFEKLYARIMDNVLAGSPVKKKIFFWALGRGLAASRKAQVRTAALFPEHDRPPDRPEARLFESSG